MFYFSEKLYLPLLNNILILFHYIVSPSIDKGQAGSKTVRTNRTAIWQIKCRGGKSFIHYQLSILFLTSQEKYVSQESRFVQYVLVKKFEKGNNPHDANVFAYVCKAL